jgi:VanZ family protein
MTKYLYLLSKNQFKVIFFLTSIFILYGTLKVSSGEHFIDFPYSDKLIHALAFFLLAFLLNRSSSNIERRIRNVIALLSFGILIEVLQSFTGYRTASLGDVLADLLGILLFQLSYSILKKWQFRRQKKYFSSEDY